MRKCAVVKEYADSGRADRKASEDEKCTKGQVSERTWSAIQTAAVSLTLLGMKKFHYRRPRLQ